MTTPLPRVKLPQLDAKSTAAQFLEDHELLTLHCSKLEAEIISLHTQNGSLVAEVGMLREMLQLETEQRVRHQGLAQSLTTRLAIIQRTITDAVTEATNHNIEPQKPEPPKKTPSELNGGSNRGSPFGNPTNQQLPANSLG